MKGNNDMTSTEKRVFTINIPRLDGYKTITVNTLILLFGMVHMVYPEFKSPTVETTGLFVDQLSAAIISVISLVNLVLRLVTDTGISFSSKSQPQIYQGSMYGRANLASHDFGPSDYAQPTSAQRAELLSRQRSALRREDLERQAWVDKPIENIDNISSNEDISEDVRNGTFEDDGESVPKILKRPKKGTTEHV